MAPFPTAAGVPSRAHRSSPGPEMSPRSVRQPDVWRYQRGEGGPSTTASSRFSRSTRPAAGRSSPTPSVATSSLLEPCRCPDRPCLKKTKTRSQREPSAASLREIPEVDFSKSRIRRNPYAARVAREGLVAQIRRGRPRKLLEVGGTRPRSVRFSDVVWKQIGGSDRPDLRLGLRRDRGALARPEGERSPFPSLLPEPA